MYDLFVDTRRKRVNNLGLVIGMALKLYVSVIKRSKLILAAAANFFFIIRSLLYETKVADLNEF